MFSEQYRKDTDTRRLSDEASDRILDALSHESAAPQRTRPLWRAVAAAAACVLLVATMLPLLKEKPPTVSFYPEWENTPPVTVHKETHLTYDEAFSLIHNYQTQYEDTEKELLGEMGSDFKNEITTDDAANQTNRGDDTATNTQYADVDEADVVKVQDGYIYVLNRAEKRVTVYRADGEKTAAVAVQKIVTDAAGSPCHMYLTPTRLVVLYTEHTTAYGDAVSKSEGKCYRYSYMDSRTYAAVYDITNPASPHHLTTYGQDGELLDSRMVDGVLYLVSGHTVWNADENDPASFVPELYRDDTAATMSESTLTAAPTTDAADYAVVTAVSTWGETARVSEKAVLGAGTCRVWANSERLMLLHSGSRRDTNDTTLKNGNTYRKTTTVDTTTLYLFDIGGGNVQQTAVATLDGTLDGQFAIDEWNGHFRVAATCGYSYSERELAFDRENKVVSNTYLNSEYTQYNRLYVLDGTLHEVGRIDNMAPDETVQSVRFDGDIGYVVTFRQTDPLFAIDLSDPQNPTVLSALKITGFSEYLHTFGDGRLLGFGYAGTEEGLNGQLKLTMFDTTDKTDVTVQHALELPTEYVFSEALDDHHAILVDTARSLVGFPAYTANTELVYLLYRYSDTDGFTPLAHLPVENAEKNEHLRGVFIEDAFYAVHPAGVTVYDGSFAPIATV
ncbi:MAG: hypothetical protein E7549_01770 [Ruminococcaceae bacterium]|nr:hypothetical protein [Oscillospiraceae bacterium]